MGPEDAVARAAELRMPRRYDHLPGSAEAGVQATARLANFRSESLFLGLDCQREIIFDCSTKTVSVI